MVNTEGYKNLIVWQKSDELVLLIYSQTKQFPKDELFGLTSQIRRASVSIPTNIVEGYARNSKTELRRFVVIALGSLAEVKYLLSLAVRLTYLDEKTYTSLKNRLEEIGRLLWKFYQSLSLASIH